MTDEEKMAHAKKVVTEFADQFFQNRRRQLEQMTLDAGTALMSFRQPFGDEWLTRGMEPQEWLIMAKAGLGLYPVVLRYAWPSELDLMARLAGLRLVHRWGSWDKGEFTAESGKHISVYGRADQNVEQ